MAGLSGPQVALLMNSYRILWISLRGKVVPSLRPEPSQLQPHPDMVSPDPRVLCVAVFYLHCLLCFI